MSNSGSFKKGIISWNKGTKGVMKAWNKGKKTPDAYLNLGKFAKKGSSSWNKNKKLSPEHIEKLRLSHLGQKAWNKGIKSGNHGNGFQKEMQTWNKGQRGLIPPENHYNWQGGKTPIHRRIRNSLLYADWRNAVLKRDNYTCQICGKYGGKLEADHIKPFSLFPELRLELSNGRTLCKRCHRETETYGALSIVKRAMTNS